MAIREWVVVGQLLARPRLVTCALFGALIALFVPAALVADAVTRGLLGWNAGALLYFILAAEMMAHSSQADMARRARRQDEGRLAILTVVVVAALASLAAIVAELGLAKDAHGLGKVLAIGLACCTIATSWWFTQIMFALHYAHNFYVNRSKSRPVGLEFPGTPDPDYLDFLYFACIIGTSGQTADVSMTSGSMRRVGLVHSVLAFFFNTTLIALTINIAAGFL